ncbi:tail sheath stabilizer [Synechococcus phage S-CRM01]|uniref:tail sheath n=1 Tax=Synechococcus phage S-CRM01 TaxID=1026955 RepID=UPI000209E34E|nr:tail sheath [Synechococcus phage S-CRM01]AEC52983.1 tail sheath stabilizer [Synechococcus phage S-CRM01]
MVVKTASPGIIVNEVDLTKGTIDAITSNVGAFCGPFEKGPVDEFVLINTEAEFQRVFGNPTEENYEYWWTVSNFLEYGGVCYVVRCDDAAGDGSELLNPNPQTMKTATDGAQAVYVKNEDDFTLNWKGVAAGKFIARNPGTWGNNLGIAVIDRGADYQFDLSTSNITDVVDGTAAAPGTTWDVGVQGGDIVGSYAKIILDGAGPQVAPGTFIEFMDGAQSIGSGHLVSIDDTNADEIYQVIVTDGTFVGADTLDIGTQSATVTGALAQGEYVLYSSSDIQNRVNVKWNPETLTVEEGFALGWPALPNNGQKRVNAAGDTFVYNSANQVWVIQYTPKQNDLITDGTSVFRISTFADWYSSQIAFQGIPWFRFASRPTTTVNAFDKGATNDGLNIILYDTTGALTGSKGNVLEQYFGVSKLIGARTQEGELNYYVDVINNRSNYIFANRDLTASDSVDELNDSLLLSPPGSTIGDGINCSFIDVKTYTLSGGVDQLEASLGELQNAYNKFNRENVSDLDYILQGPGLSNFDDSIAKANFLISIVEERRDCMCFISPPRYMVVNQADSETITKNIISFAQELSSSSYAVFDSGYKYTYDRFNDKYRYVPLNGDVAGLLVFSSIVAEPWFSPAGMSRGQIRNVVKLPYNPSKTQRDELYADRVNPIVTFPGEGTVLFGDKTALGYTSAFDRINVRKLFLVIERAIAKSARTNLFEFNDDITRSLFKNNVNPFLRDVQSKRGIFDFLVVCDSSNNPPEIIDRNEFIADFYIKPSRSINYIGLNFIATKTGVTFDESVGLFRGTNQTTNR